jgi:hypothetical protein
MLASQKGHHEVVRTLLESGGLVNVKDKVRNQLMMMMIIIILLLTILMMMLMIVIDVLC